MFIAFDLDGTIADPSEGITNCINHTLVTLNLPTRPKEQLIQYIGPPTEWIFSHLLNTDDKEKIEQAREIFKKEYLSTGYKQNKLFELSNMMLNSLKDDGHFLTIVTSKSSSGAKKIAEHCNFSKYFKGVYGRVNDCSKIDSLATALASSPIRPAVMIGDRKFDIEAAKHHGIISIGVTWGFGSVSELEKTNPDHIVSSQQVLLDLINRLK